MAFIGLQRNLILQCALKRTRQKENKKGAERGKKSKRTKGKTWEKEWAKEWECVWRRERVLAVLELPTVLRCMTSQFIYCARLLRCACVCAQWCVCAQCVPSVCVCVCVPFAFVCQLIPVPPPNARPSSPVAELRHTQQSPELTFIESHAQ